jgi:cytochrome o ubiquinol oxidase subunit 1
MFTVYRGRIEFHPSMVFTIGFMVTFVIGGVTGVLLALPPADYLMHNSTFLVAHFHNMLIPGALFGYFAGLNYWFPKAFGFKLDAKWGIRSFWFWIIGFYLAFMPLYVLGFMGMSRRMEHYADPTWQPYLVVAALGALCVLAGIVCIAVQLYVSAKNWGSARDTTGDPWNGRTLEWATSSPPAPYNFAVIPEVRDLDAFHDMKIRGAAYQAPVQYEDIVMPKSSGIGPILGALSFVLGFAMVWYIWWLAALCLVLSLVCVGMRACDDDSDFVMPAAEVARIENARLAQLSMADMHDMRDFMPRGAASGAALPGRA